MLDVFGVAFLDYRYARGTEDIGEAKPLERAQHGVAEPAHDHNANVVAIPGNDLVELALPNERLRSRQAVFDLEALVDERHGWMGEAPIIEARRARQTIKCGITTR